MSPGARPIDAARPGSLASRTQTFAQSFAFRFSPVAVSRFIVRQEVRRPPHHTPWRWAVQRVFNLAVAQVGGIQPSEDRAAVVRRLINLLEKAHRRGASFVVFPELTLTTFFPRYWHDEAADVDAYFEREMPGPE